MNGKKMRGAASLFMSLVLSATLMVPNIAFAQTTTGKDTTATTTTTAATQDTATPAATAPTTATPTTATTTTAASTESATAPATTQESMSQAAAVQNPASTQPVAETATQTEATGAEDSTSASQKTASTSSHVDQTYSTGLAVDPLAIEKQNALNQSYNEANGTASKTITTQSTTAASTLPSKYDLRTADTYDGTWSARNQAPWGCCWAFGNTAAIESNILKQKDGAGASSLDLAERQLAWFAGVPVNAQTVIAGRTIDPDQYGEGTGSNLDRGGSGNIASEVLTTWQGLASESQGIPYLAKDGSITKDNDLWSLTEAQRALAAFHVTNVDKLPSTANASNPTVKGNLTYYENTYNPTGTEEIKKALMSTGGVSIAFHVDVAGGLGNSSQYWNSKTGAQYISQLIAAGAGATNAEKAQATTANHGVCIVGWDDTYSANNFVTKPSADGAFLCRNSWGSYGRYVNSTIGGQSVPLETCTTSSGQDMGQVFYQNGQIYLIRNGQVAGLGVDKVTLTKSTTDGLNVTEIYTDQAGTTYTIKKTINEDGKDAPTFDGYFWLSYYDATIADPSAYTAEAAESNDKNSTYHIYEKDYLGLASQIATNEGAFDTTTTASTSTASGTQSTSKTVVAQVANVFTAVGNEALTAVSVATKSAANTVEVFIYRLINGAKSPTQSANGKPEITTTVTVNNAGYHTIDLSRPLYLHAGESFSVVERIMNAAGQGYVPLELGTSGLPGEDGGYITYTAKAGAGESYISQDGGKTWIDVSTIPYTSSYWADKYPAAEYAAAGIKLEGVGNAMIRAFTVDWTPAPTPAPATPAAQTATATTASYTPAAESTVVQAELPKTADDMGITCMLLVLLAAAGMGAAIGARRKATCK